MTSTTSHRVAVLGTGVMGQGMTRSLLRAGHRVTAWNRTPDKAAALAGDGARVAGTAAEAVRGADVVLTVLYDADAVLDVVETALDGLSPEAVWVQSSTVGVEGADRVARLAERHGVRLVDAPVLGTRKPAEDGTLVVLASGEPELRDRVAPVLDAVGSRTLWVGDRPGPASALKLACNAWVAAVTAGVAQSLALTEALGLDPELFLRAIEGGALDTPYAHVKGAAMIADEFPVSFALAGLVKDLGLVVDAGKAAGTDPVVAAGIAEAFRRAGDQGLGSEDIAAVHRVLRRTR